MIVITKKNNNQWIKKILTAEYEFTIKTFWSFLIPERMKVLSYQNSIAKPYLWRITQQQEIDYVETVADDVNAF